MCTIIIINIDVIIYFVNCVDVIMILHRVDF